MDILNRLPVHKKLALMLLLPVIVLLGYALNKGNINKTKFNIVPNANKL